MQSGYGASEIHQQQQHLIDDGDGDADDCGGPSVFTINSNPQNNHHLYNQHLQQQQQQHQMFQQLPPHFSPFTHQLLHPFQTFHPPQQQLGFEAQHSTCPTSYPFFDVNFKLGLNENSSNKDEQQQQQHHHSLVMQPHPWHSQEDSSAIKLQHQPFCNTNVEKEADPEIERECNKNYKKHVMGTKYKHFGGELEEAIYSLANANANANINVETNNQITCSGSAIVGVDLDQGSENSVGEEASLDKVHEKKKKKKKRKRKMKEELSSIVGFFFERLVKQVMDHQVGLHRKFLEFVQRIDREKFERDESRRREEAAKYKREAITRALEQEMASSREAMIVSYIEKITGQSINLPPRKTTALSRQPEVTTEPTKELNSCRWPKAEVEALIQVRGGLESRFSEPGLKGPLWEEVSALMASMGYQRSAKRCKEKWENINKYFRKTKESGKQRSPQSKTCPYFDHLDQLYSSNMLNLPLNPDMGEQNQGYSELLEAFDAVRDLGIANETVEVEHGSHGDEKENQRDEDKVDANEKEDC